MQKMKKRVTMVNKPGEAPISQEYRQTIILRNISLLVLRLTLGGMLAGHGAQKLFGWFGGYGLKGTAGWLESLGMKPGNIWAAGASASEFGGGTLTTLGLSGLLQH